MKVADVFNTANEAITVKRVYAEPHEKDGLAVIPAAVVRDGGGAEAGTTMRATRVRAVVSA